METTRGILRRRLDEVDDGVVGIEGVVQQDVGWRSSSKMSSELRVEAQLPRQEML